MGPKRAAYSLYSSLKINAQTAKELGLVHEVVPLERLLSRVNKIADRIMAKLRSIRRLTTAVLRRQWKRRLVQDLGFPLRMSYLACT
jgi:enoyl-CoA hydratase/carnithine racemase